MNVICSKAGTREKCASCEHSIMHAFSVLKGCEMGRCYPDEEVKNTITGEPIMVKQHIPCMEIPVKTEVIEQQITQGGI